MNMMNDEIMALISTEEEESENEDEPKHDRCLDQNSDKLSQLESFYIMLGFSFGTGILLISDTIRQLGPIGFFVIFTCVLSTSCFSCYILHKCVLHAMKEQNWKTLHDPYQKAAESAGGFILKKFTCVMMYVWDLMTGLSVLLVAVQLISGFMPFQSLSESNNIRVWVILIALVITPFMYLGTYSDLKLPALIALLTSSISFVLVIINCFLKQYYYPTIDTSINNAKIEPLTESFFISIGSIIFVSGTSMTIANVTALSSKPDKIGKTIVGSFASLYVIFMTVGMMSYFSFGGNVAPSIISTFEIIISNRPEAVDFQAITMLTQLLMFIHMMMVTIISMNPLYLHLEEALNIPREFNYKRVISRTICVIIMISICLAIPHFQFAVSIAGGVPYTIMGIFLPAFMYTRIFEINLYLKLVIYVFLGLVVVFMVGNLIISCIQLFR